MLSYAKLPVALKRRVVVMIAKGYLLTEIAKALHDEHGFDVSIARLQRYDPRTATGSGLSADLKELFECTRQKALEDLEALDTAYRPMRVAALHRIYERAVDRHDDRTALRALDQIRIEMDGLELIDVDPPEGDGSW